MSRLLGKTLNLQGVPTAARWLGLGGLIPFVVPALVLCVADGALAEFSQLALAVYGAVILSFLGGVRWGVLLSASEAGGWWPWILSIMPSLVGWLAVLIGGAAGLVLLAVGFAAQWQYDVRAVRAAALPGWFGALRTVLSAGAIFSVLLGALVA